MANWPFLMTLCHFTLPPKNLCRIPCPPFLFARQVSNFAQENTEVVCSFTMERCH
jgi:hypothetical protein